MTTLTVTPGPTPPSLSVRGYALDDLSNVACQDFLERVETCGGGGSGSNSGYLDLSLYLDPADALTDAQIAAYPDTSTWVDVSADLRRAATAAGDAGLQMYHGGVRGRYFLDLQDTPQPILFRHGSGFQGPDVSRIQLSYASDGAGGVKDVIPNVGLIFVVDINSSRRNIPKIALQGATTTRKMQIAGVGLVHNAPQINVASYPTVSSVPAGHCPVVVTDHRHDNDGNPVASAKAGGVTLEAHFVGLRQWAYIGDPLVSEESWAGLTASGNQTGISFTNLYLTGSTCERALGVARSTAGGLNAFVQAIPPYHTGISQPNSGGLTNYAWLKYFQQTGRVIDWWHRAVGFNVEIQARGFRYGCYYQAGAGLGPVGQDTGKYNAGTVKQGVERVITGHHFADNAYGHRLNLIVNGHYMDEYNLKGETGSVIEVLTDGTIAGAVDKAVYDAWVNAHDYNIDDKISDGSGNVYSCIQAGTSSVIPSTSGPNYNSTTLRFTDPGAGGPIWIFRNGGFKPVGRSPFARIFVSGTIQEAAGRVFSGNVNDGHLYHDHTSLDPANWSQAKTHHDEAAFYNPSTSTILIHANSNASASGNAKRVYDVANPQNLVVGNNRYLGQVIPVDGSGVPTGVFPTAIGGNLLDSFWWGKNCLAFSAGSALGDDDGDDSDD